MGTLTMKERIKKQCEGCGMVGGRYRRNRLYIAFVPRYEGIPTPETCDELTICPMCSDHLNRHGYLPNRPLSPQPDCAQLALF